MVTHQPPGQQIQPLPMHTMNPLHPQAPTLTPTAGMPGSPRNPLDHPGGGTGFPHAVANLPGVPLETPQHAHGSWADRSGAGGNPGFGLSGPGKLSPLPSGGGSRVNLPGVVGNAGAQRPGPASPAYAGRGGGAGGEKGGTFSPTGGGGGEKGGTFSPTGGGGITLSDGGVRNLPGSAPALMTGSSGSWAATAGAGGEGGGGGHTGGPGFAALGPGHGPGRGHGGGGATQVGAVGHGTGLTPGVGAGSGPGRAEVGGGSGGGLDGHGTPTSGGDPLGTNLRNLPIASSGGAKGTGGPWADQPGGGGGIDGHGLDLAPSGPSFSAQERGEFKLSYPPLAIKEHQQGTVEIALTIGSNSRIEKWTYLRHSSSNALDNAALKALRRVQYRAAMRNGERVAGTLKFRFTFKTGQQPEVKQL